LPIFPVAVFSGAFFPLPLLFFDITFCFALFSTLSFFFAEFSVCPNFRCQFFWLPFFLCSFSVAVFTYAVITLHSGLTSESAVG